MQDGTTESVCKMGQQSQCARRDNRVSVHDRIRQCVKWDNRVSVQDGTIESVCKMGQQSQCARWDNSHCAR